MTAKPQPRLRPLYIRSNPNPCLGKRAPPLTEDPDATPVHWAHA
jgi:hypothetical protein